MGAAELSAGLRSDLSSCAPFGGSARRCNCGARPSGRCIRWAAAIWRDPGDVERLDLYAGPGGPDGAPQPPFTYLEEHFGGSRPCVSVRDARGRRWRLKWGDEVQVEALATRLAWAVGYFAETTYYVQQGRVEQVGELKRAGSCLDNAGAFTAARFELEEEDVITHFDEHSWAWSNNPFVGSRELNGLKIVMMWLSNWDAKDVRDVALGSNTAIFEHRLPDGGREARYLITDWGGALGRWGNIVSRGRWDCAGFAEQTPSFVQGVDGEFVRWGIPASGPRISPARFASAMCGGLHALSRPPACRANWRRRARERRNARRGRLFYSRVAWNASINCGLSSTRRPPPSEKGPSARRRPKKGPAPLMTRRDNCGVSEPAVCLRKSLIGQAL